MAVAAASAAVASFSGLRGLALLAGWPVGLAWLLPLTVDAYAMTSARVWLSGSTRSAVARRFARANALGAIAASIAGNAAYHAVETGLLLVSWPIVVAVGAVPAAVLGLTAHLHALRARSEPDPKPRTHVSDTGSDAADRTGRLSGAAARRTESGPRDTRRGATRRQPRGDAELWAAARDADQRYRRAHGRPITRDALRTELHVSGARAGELRRRLVAEHQTPAQGRKA